MILALCLILEPGPTFQQQKICSPHCKCDLLSRASASDKPNLESFDNAVNFWQWERFHLERMHVDSLADLALQSEHNLLGGLSLLVENWLCLTSIPRLLTVISPLPCATMRVLDQTLRNISRKVRSSHGQAAGVQ